jgi:hypothetical protein
VTPVLRTRTGVDRFGSAPPEHVEGDETGISDLDALFV